MSYKEMRKVFYDDVTKRLKDIARHCYWFENKKEVAHMLNAKLEGVVDIAYEFKVIDYEEWFSLIEMIYSAETEIILA